MKTYFYTIKAYWGFNDETFVRSGIVKGKTAEDAFKNIDLSYHDKHARLSVRTFKQIK